MARSVNTLEYAEKRNAILDAAQRYISTKGYEQMTTQDILDDLQISRGAFYHYFDSKSALLFALIERMVDQFEELVLPIIHNPNLGALEKLQLYLTTSNHRKLEHKHFVLAFLRVWYADENALVRHKLYTTSIKRTTPWLEEIILQGVQEGVFTTSYPDQAARIIMSLFEDLGYATGAIFIAEEHVPSDLSRLIRIVEATTDAMERVLGVQPGCLQHAWRDELSPWLVNSTEKQTKSSL